MKNLLRKQTKNRISLVFIFVSETKFYGQKCCNRMEMTIETQLNIFMQLQQILFIVAIA